MIEESQNKEKENKEKNINNIDINKSKNIDNKTDEKNFTKIQKYFDDMAKNKMVEQNIFLKKAKERKLKEQKNREIIDNILLKCKQRAFNINNM